MVQSEETTFNAAVCHYFLWRAAQGAPAQSPQATALAQRRTDDKNAASTTTAEDNSSCSPDTNENDGDKKLPAQAQNKSHGSSDDSRKDDTNREVAPSPAANHSAKYLKLAELMQELFPRLKPPLVPPVAPSVSPYVLARFSMFPQLHQEVLGLRSLVHSLEMQNIQLQTTLLNQSSAGTSTHPPSHGGAHKTLKRKTPPIAEVAANAKLPLTSPSRKRARAMAAAAPGTKTSESATSKKKSQAPPGKVTRQMKILSRQDIPDDVKALVALVRNDLKNEKKKNKRKIKQLQETVEKAKAKPPPPPPPREPSVPKTRPKIYPIKPPEPPATWEENFEQLKHFVKGNGHCRVPVRHPGIGRWVAELRATHTYLQLQSEEARNILLSRKPTRAADLNYERMGLLNELGFTWRAAPPNLTFEERYQQLVDFKEKNGHLLVTRSCNDPPGLANYVHNVRKDYKRNAESVSKERKEKLDASKWTIVARSFKCVLPFI